MAELTSTYRIRAFVDFDRSAIRRFESEIRRIRQDVSKIKFKVIDEQEIKKVNRIREEIEKIPREKRIEFVAEFREDALKDVERRAKISLSNAFGDALKGIFPPGMVKLLEDLFENLLEKSGALAIISGRSLPGFVGAGGGNLLKKDIRSYEDAIRIKQDLKAKDLEELRQEQRKFNELERKLRDLTREDPRSKEIERLIEEKRHRMEMAQSRMYQLINNISSLDQEISQLSADVTRFLQGKPSGGGLSKIGNFFTTGIGGAVSSLLVEFGLLMAAFYALEQGMKAFSDWYDSEEFLKKISDDLADGTEEAKALEKVFKALDDDLSNEEAFERARTFKSIFSDTVDVYKLDKAFEFLKAYSSFFGKDFKDAMGDFMNVQRDQLKNVDEELKKRGYVIETVSDEEKKRLALATSILKIVESVDEYMKKGKDLSDFQKKQLKVLNEARQEAEKLAISFRKVVEPLSDEQIGGVLARGNVFLAKESEMTLKGLQAQIEETESALNLLKFSDQESASALRNLLEKLKKKMDDMRKALGLVEMAQEVKPIEEEPRIDQDVVIARSLDRFKTEELTNKLLSMRIDYLKEESKNLAYSVETRKNFLEQLRWALFVQYERQKLESELLDVYKNQTKEHEESKRRMEEAFKESKKIKDEYFSRFYLSPVERRIKDLIDLSEAEFDSADDKLRALKEIRKETLTLELALMDAASEGQVENAEKLRRHLEDLRRTYQDVERAQSKQEMMFRDVASMFIDEFLNGMDLVAGRFELSMKEAINSIFRYFLRMLLTSALNEAAASLFGAAIGVGTGNPLAAVGSAFGALGVGSVSSVSPSVNVYLDGRIVSKRLKEIDGYESRRSAIS